MINMNSQKSGKNGTPSNLKNQTFPELGFRRNILLILVVTGTLIFLLLAYLVHTSALQNIDKHILLLFRSGNNVSTPVGPVWLTEIVRDITSLGSEVILTLLVVISSLYFYFNKNSHALFLILSSSIGSFLLDIFLKNIISRDRPDLVLHIMFVATKSFPSGHAMVSASIYFPLSYLIISKQTNLKMKIFIISAALTLIIIIGVSRLYLGVHYPSDVFAGWIAGLTWASICLYLYSYFFNNTRI